MLQPTQVKEDASSQVSQVSNMYPIMNAETVALLFVIAAKFGLVGVVVIDSILTTQVAEAKGCINPNAPGGGSIAFNASKGRCVQP